MRQGAKTMCVRAPAAPRPINTPYIYIYKIKGWCAGRISSLHPLFLVAKYKRPRESILPSLPLILDRVYIFHDYYCTHAMTQEQRYIQGLLVYNTGDEMFLRRDAKPVPQSAPETLIQLWERENERRNFGLWLCSLQSGAHVKQSSKSVWWHDDDWDEL
jgi:hypothetical protein